MTTTPGSQALFDRSFRAAKAIRDRVTFLKGLDYASGTPLLLAGMIESLAIRVDSFLRRERDKGGYESEAYRQARSGFLILANFLHAHLEYVEDAVVRRTPWSLVRPFEELAESIHGHAAFLLRPIWSYNYTIYECVENLRGVVDRPGIFESQEEIDSFYSQFPQRLYITSFPRLERLNVLFHVLLGHEIAHPIADEWVQGEDEESLIGEIRRRLTTALKVPSDLFDYSSLPDEIYTIRTCALQELMCDYACVLLFGPAALFAFDALGKAMGLDMTAPGDYHPPWRYRLRHTLALLPATVLGAYLERCKLKAEERESLSRRYREIEELVSDDSDIRWLNQQLPSRIAYEFVEKAKPKAQEFIAQKLEKAGFTLDTLPTAGIADLIDRLQNGILPNEYWVDRQADDVDTNPFWGCRVPVTADLRTILLSATFHRAHHLPSAKDCNLSDAEYSQVCHATDRLVLRAIECAYLWRRYNKLGKAYGDPDQQ